ncbi:hypothetical protein GCM10027051_26780 [Niabella terrae]
MVNNFFNAALILLLVVTAGACTKNVREQAAGQQQELIPDDRRAAAGDAAGGLVYFQQDFNSSTDYASYVGSGSNQFDGLRSNGSASINTLNNTLQIVKNGGSGTNRASATKTDHPFNPDGVGGFLRFEMKVTITNNTDGSNVSNGFQFSVGMGMSGTAPGDPSDDNLHSAFYVSPVATEGAFMVKGLTADGKIDGEAVNGTQKLVWYINNSGVPAGYTAPDGVTLASVLNDSWDLWAVDENGEVQLLLDDIAALTPDIEGLRQFKISNNANFLATLDIDDILIVEEPLVELKKITGLSPVAAVSAPVKTIFSLLPLPEYLDVTLEDGSTDRAGVRWSAVGNYNPYHLGAYEVRGDIIASNGTINLDELYVTTTATLREGFNIVDAFTPNGDGINDTWVIPDLRCFVRSSVQVLDGQGRSLFYSTDPLVAWDGKDSQGQIRAGAYYYIIKVPDLLMEKKGTVRVVK